MKNFLTILAGLGLVAFIATAEATTILFITNNIMWLLVVGILACVVVVVMVKALGMRQHNITYIDNRQWNDQRQWNTHTTTTSHQSYFDYRGHDRIAESVPMLRD